MRAPTVGRGTVLVIVLLGLGGVMDGVSAERGMGGGYKSFQLAVFAFITAKQHTEQTSLNTKHPLAIYLRQRLITAVSINRQPTI